MKGNENRIRRLVSEDGFEPSIFNSTKRVSENQDTKD